MKTVTASPTSAAARADYARATMRTAAVMADPAASLMDRFHAAEAEEAACEAYRAEIEPEAEAGILWPPRHSAAARVDQLLEGREDMPRLVQDRPAIHLHRSFERLRRVGYVIDESDSARLDSADDIAAAQERQRSRWSDQCCQIVKSAPRRRDCQPSLNEPDASMGCRDSKVARSRQFSPSAQGIAVQSRDDRHRKISNLFQDSAGSARHLGGTVEVANRRKLVQIAARYPAGRPRR